MKHLIIEKQIEINALPSLVWDAITKKEFTDVWSHEFAPQEPGFFIYCDDWNTMGAQVEWKKEMDADPDEIVLTGNVTAVESNKLLRFTVFDKEHSEITPVFTEDDGIEFRITQENGHSVLHVRHGDFGKMANGEMYYEASMKVWDRALPKIRDMAERKLEPHVRSPE